MDGAELGHFSLLEKIGEGGMGRVYKARDRRLERLVAIKLLAESRLADAGQRTRFVQEAKAASALNHPNIITIHEIGEQDGRTFIVMELVDGKPLNELIPHKGMRLTEVLRVAAQVAAALAAAHAAGIVHRDLKPANIMVDALGRVKVLDFGLAKLAAPASIGADESTRTFAMDQPLTEEGAIVGSVPYMSPEQAEGKPVDARSDIFSFGAVLYEMVTGQRAFRGESRISTLAAIVEKEPQPPSEISSSTPPELERLIARCLRKDVNRRSQNMTDVKLALEELREESESGKLVRPAAAGPAPVGWRRWLWPAAAVACALIAVAAIGWTWLNRRGGTQFHGPELVRLSPDDGHSYSGSAISPDGKFVAYISDRTGKDELWLQQVGGADPIQLTHSAEPVYSAAFFPDGTRILYATAPADPQKYTIEVIPTLGGQPRVLVKTGGNGGNMLSPDGRQIAYFDTNQSPTRLMIVSSDGGPPRELPNWTGRTTISAATWTSDSGHLLCTGSKQAGATNFDEWDWFALPVDGGSPVATGAGEALRAAGLKVTVPYLMTSDRVLFAADKGGRKNTWEIRLSPGSWRVTGAPHQLIFGTADEIPSSVSATGTLAVDAAKESADLYLIPVSPTSGQPTGIARRLTQDGRVKMIRTAIGGDFGSVHFLLGDYSSQASAHNVYALDLESAKQTLLIPAVALDTAPRVSTDGRQIAYSVPEGDAYSTRIGEPGAGAGPARVLCKAAATSVSFPATGVSYSISPNGPSSPILSGNTPFGYWKYLPAGTGPGWSTRPIPSWARAFSATILVGSRSKWPRRVRKIRASPISSPGGSSLSHSRSGSR